METGTTLRKRAGDVTIGVRAILTSTIRYGTTRRVGTVLAGTGATVRALWVKHMVAPLGRPTRIL